MTQNTDNGNMLTFDRNNESNFVVKDGTTLVTAGNNKVLPSSHHMDTEEKSPKVADQSKHLLTQQKEDINNLKQH